MTTETLNTKTTAWALDPAHSELTFKVKHLMISTVTGKFKQFDVTAGIDPDNMSQLHAIRVVAAVDSIDTGNAQRDNHLRSQDFFNVEKFPQLFFEGDRYEGDEEKGQLHGRLTIKNFTRDIVLYVEVGGVITDPYGQMKAGFTIHGKISRRDFGLTWNAVTESGGVIVADEINMYGDIQLVKQSE